MRQWIINAREEAKMSQADLALAVGIAASYMSLIENGKRGTNLSAMLIMSIASALGLSNEDALQAEAAYQASIERAE